MLIERSVIPTTSSFRTNERSRRHNRAARETGGDRGGQTVDLLGPQTSETILGIFRAARFAAAFLLAAALSAAPSSAAQADASTPAQAEATKQQRPLRDLVISFVDYGNQDAEQECLAKAVYFEARSESLDGQLAVAEVVLNRAKSGLYPATICGVVTQPAQFSFIRAGKFPDPDRTTSHWRTAVAIADIAQRELADAVAPNVLWYHATYVAPSWGRRLNRVAQIGTHIFYS